MSKKVLMIVSNAYVIGPHNRRTGNFLPEVTHPYTALSQIIENRKVGTRKSLIFQYTIFGLCLEKAILRQSPISSLTWSRIGS